MFADGFDRGQVIANQLTAPHLPIGGAVAPDGSYFVGDQRTEILWRITWAGDDAAPPVEEIVASAPPPDVDPAVDIALAQLDDDVRLAGEDAYRQHCSVCHQLSGSGAPGFHPSLIESELLAGRPERLVDYIVTGRGGPRGDWSGAMPVFPELVLDDAALADLLSYARAAFAGADAVSAEEVGEVRAGDGRRW